MKGLRHRIQLCRPGNSHTAQLVDSVLYMTSQNPVNASEQDRHLKDVSLT